MQPRSIALLQKIDSNVEQMLQKFQDIFEVAINQEKPKELLAVESLTIESDALTIIRLCQDLLSISRSLKETWCLGTLKVNEKSDITWEKDEVNKVFDQFNALTDRIAQFENKASLTTI
ncbi:mediator complex, subunit Med22 [Scheffersomyces xylosifermentans]|uniref:mediator complex, subunit Med22 n=1 Tax=Scheffersomyces xylosifermentans TaxID=1304137 RepID=UPI00315DCCE2